MDDKKFDVDAPKYVPTLRERIAKWTGGIALGVALAGVMGAIASALYCPPSSMRGINGEPVPLFKHITDPQGVKEANEQRLIRNIIDARKPAWDSTAQAHRAGIKNEFYGPGGKFAPKGKRFPTRNPRKPVAPQQARMPQRH